MPSIELPQAGEMAGQGPSLLIRGFEFSGNTRISSAELNAQLSELVGSELTLAELQNVSLILTGYYASEGYLARFVLPPQEVVDGIVHFNVVEGIQSAVEVSQEGDRVDAGRVRAFIEARSQSGQVLDANKLGEALNILNDQPGVAASTTLQPGANEQEVSINITATDLPLVSYNLGLNNYGTKAAGQARASFGVGISNLSSRFDLLRFGLNKTDGSTSLTAGYGFALGNRGMRLNVDATALDYDLVQAEFQALDATGDARTLGVELSYPLSRELYHGSNVTLRLEQSQLEDNTIAGQTGDRRVRTLNIGISQYSSVFDGWFQGLVNKSISVTLGNTDQKNAAALAVDAVTRDINGFFAKVDISLSHLRALNETWSVFSSISGQLANKNLDSSARFSLGGATGVRGFPTSEATGDEGFIANITLNRGLGEPGSLAFFVDYGRIHVNDNGANLLSATPNWYSLSSAGVELGWLFNESIGARATLAQPLSSNPGSTDGRDLDGRKLGTRVWFSLSAQF